MLGNTFYLFKLYTQMKRTKPIIKKEKHLDWICTTTTSRCTYKGLSFISTSRHYIEYATEDCGEYEEYNDTLECVETGDYLVDSDYGMVPNYDDAIKSYCNSL